MQISVTAILNVNGEKSSFSYFEDSASAFSAVQAFRRDAGSDFVSATARSEYHGDATKYDTRRPWLHYFATNI